MLKKLKQNTTINIIGIIIFGLFGLLNCIEFIFVNPYLGYLNNLMASVIIAIGLYNKKSAAFPAIGIMLFSLDYLLNVYSNIYNKINYPNLYSYSNFDYFYLTYLIAFLALSALCISSVKIYKSKFNKDSNALSIVIIVSTVIYCLYELYIIIQYIPYTITAMGIFSVISKIFEIIVIIVLCKILCNFLPKKTKPENVMSDNTVGAWYASGYCGLAKHIILLLVTFGIWQLIWIYKTTNFTNYDKTSEFRNPVNKLLLNMFIPFYFIYWIYVTALRIDNLSKSKGDNSQIATVCLICGIFIPFVSLIVMQNQINKICTMPNVAVNNGGYNAETDILRQYKKMLDDGVITQEDFENKKKEFIK